MTTTPDEPTQPFGDESATPSPPVAPDLNSMTHEELRAFLATAEADPGPVLVAPAPPILPVPTDADEATARAMEAQHRRKVNLIRAAVAAAVIIAVIVVAVIVKQTAKMSVEGTFDFSGTHVTDSGDCVGTEGYDDISSDTQVTISADGHILAVSTLGTPASATDASCTWAFSLDGVSKNHSVYTVEVGHRGGISYTKAQIEAGDVGVTLG